MAKAMSAAEADALMQYASTEKQRQTLILVKETGSITKAARELGYGPNDGHVRNLITRLRAKAAAQGYAPDHGWDHPVPDTHIAKGVSRYFKLEDGGIWVKADIKQEERESLVKEALEGFKDELPRAKKVAAPKKNLSADLLNQYTITDYHLGMYAWHEESGDDWDLKIAEDMLVAWFEAAVEKAPDCEQAVFAQIGDFLHYDGLEAVTPTHRHILDTDTRHQKMVRVGLRVRRKCIDILLRKHLRVHLIEADANHDPAGSAWAREAFALFYENESRVTVETSPNPFYAYEWGNTSLFYHHGHRVKPDLLGEAFAARFRELFGRTKYAYGHCGHLHHKYVVKEKPLMPIEQHQTLAAKDAYGAGLGHHAGRSAQVITYSKEFGEVGRVRITPEMLV